MIEPCGTSPARRALGICVKRTQIVWGFCRRKALWIWTHRTKTVGGIGVGAGAIQYHLANHPEIKLPHEGVLLMFFGSIVAIVGTYNSLAQFFGWTDPPP